MDLISILTTVILTTTIGTVLVGVAAYAAFKLRDQRKPKAKKGQDASATGVLEPIFLTPYLPACADSGPVASPPRSAPAATAAPAGSSSTTTVAGAASASA